MEAFVSYMQEFIRNLHPRQGYKNDLACRTLVFAFSDILSRKVTVEGLKPIKHWQAGMTCVKSW
jgi:hypothetical protein